MEARRRQHDQEARRSGGLLKLAVTSFRGEAPRVTPRALPDNAAQAAVNCRLQTGDLESWRQFALTKTLANAGPVQTVYLLNGAWLSWTQQVEVARGVIAGDDTYRTYLTCPSLYGRPQFTTYAMATAGPEPFPVQTRPLGVPPPDTAPALALGVDASPTTFSVDVTDQGDALKTDWQLSEGQVDTADYSSMLRQNDTFGHPGACYESDCQKNENNPAYMKRDFGIADTTVATMTVDLLVHDVGGNDSGEAVVAFGVDASGSGARVGFRGKIGSNLRLRIHTGESWKAGLGSVLIEQACTGGLAKDVWYTLQLTKTLKEDKTATIKATLLRDGTVLGTVATTNNFTNGGFCAPIAVHGDDRLIARYDNFHVQGSGSTNYVATNTATSYVYTFVNDLSEEGPPSPASSTVLRADGVSVTVTTPTSTPSGTLEGYGITTKRLYRAVTGASGTLFLLVAEQPLAEGIFVDTKDDSEIADSDVLPSEDWDPPPDGLQGIIALPNGIMAGFYRNQLCLSAAGRPHAWPVANRLTVDTDIVAIANLDNTIVIGTKSFPYTATGNDPASYSMSKPGDPQACVSKRSMVFLPDVGVVYASPDGLMVCTGSAGQIANMTAGIFTKRQWQALDPASVISAVHDGVLFFFTTGQTPASGYALDTTDNGFGLVRLSFHATAAHADPLTDSLHLVLDRNNEPTDPLLVLPSTAPEPDGMRLYQFDAGPSDMVYRWRGKLNEMPYPMALLVAQVRALDFTNLVVRFFGDGRLVYERRLDSMAEFTLPMLDAFDEHEMELMGTVTVKTLQAAEDVLELT